MVSSRQKIIEYLSTKRAATAYELSNILHVSPANVRHHLSILTREGVVRNAGTRAPQVKGRPAKIFTLTDQALENNLGLLASTLLSEFIWSLPAEEHNAALRSLAKNLCGRDEMSPQWINLTQRLYQTVQRLNELNYHARWEAHREAPQIILAHCPYAEILDKHPEMCRMDTYLLEELVQVPVIQSGKLIQGSLGLPFCTFVVNVDHTVT